MRKAITAIGILFCCSVYGQSVLNLNLSFNHMALSVKDVNQSADFYKNVLGLQEITNRAKMDGIRWFSFGEGKELHLISIVKDPVIINKGVHLALTTDNFDALLKTLNANKVVYSDWPGTLNKVNIRADGIKQVFFQDPNGYWIEVNSVGQK
jgi:catechol 2,3-dioxygenase-like lactoylglutathione lyase family enzyme